MANRLKKKTAKPPSADKLNPDKEEEVSVREVVKDERTSKIVGAVSLLFSAFLFIAFTSYFFTWQQDQDKVSNYGVKIFATDDVHAENLLGVLGAYISYTFIDNGFGVASFLFCTFFFVLGVNLLFGQKIFNVARNLRYLIAGLIVLSVAFAFVFDNSSFNWGGDAGKLMRDWLVKWIGKIGTGAVLTLTVLAYIIWRFNPEFKLPKRKPKELRPEVATPGVSDLFKDEYEKSYFNPEDRFSTAVNEGLAKEDVLTSNNKLRNESSVVVIMPETKTDDVAGTLSISEKEPAYAPLVDELTKHGVNDVQELPAEDTAGRIRFKKEKSEEEMELEIKDSIEEEDEESVALPKPEISNPKPQIVNYEPTLDLSNYKYPSLLSPRSVEGIRTRLIEKVGVRNTAGLVMFAVKNGLAE